MSSYLDKQGLTYVWGKIKSLLSSYITKTTADGYYQPKGSYVTTTGNAASASKLNVGRKLWGVLFDGSKDISGDITDCDSIMASQSNMLTLNGLCYVDRNGNIDCMNVGAADIEANNATFSNSVSVEEDLTVNEGSFTVSNGTIYSRAGGIDVKGGTINIRKSTENSSLDISRDKIYNNTNGATMHIGLKYGDLLISAGSGNDNVNTHPTLTLVGTENTIVSNRTITVYSDERLKDIQYSVDLPAESIANIRSVAYKWNARNDDGKYSDDKVYVGSIAQDWQRLIPELVREYNNTLTLDYTGAAIVSVISLAKEIVELKREIAKLKEK